MIDNHGLQYLSKKQQVLSEGYSNIDASQDLDTISSYQDDIKMNIKRTQNLQREGELVDTEYVPMLNQTVMEGDGQIQYLNNLKAQNSTLASSYLKTISPEDSFLGKNVQFTGNNKMGYITNQGIFKSYGNNNTLIGQNAGNNGCPAGVNDIPGSMVNHQSTGAPFLFIEGTPMKPYQSCGNEGENVFVSSVSANPSADYLGAFYDNMESPLMTFLDNGQDTFSYADCMQAAVNNNYTYFGLQNANTSQSNQLQSVQCAVATDDSQAMSMGEAVAGCQQQSDGYAYGSQDSTALYETPTAQFVATFGDNPNRAMTLINGGSQTFSFKDCYKYASENGYQYFGLQNGTGPSNAQCAVSNDYSQLSQYGETDNQRFSIEDKKIYGGGWANSVYEINTVSPNVGCFNSGILPLIGYNTNFQDCQSLASSQNYKYFGLTNGGPGTASCVATNSEAEATMNGEYHPSVTLPDNNVYGGPGVNAIYKVTSSGSISNLGNIGYVDSNSDLMPYPSNLLNYQQPNYVPLNNVIENTSNSLPSSSTSVSLEQCQQSCTADPNCVGVLYDDENNCYTQPAGFLQQPPSAGSGTSLATALLQVPAVTNNASCSQNVNVISSDLWNNYQQNGNQMSADQLCGVAEVTQPFNTEINNASDTLQGILGQISSYAQPISSYLEGFDGGLYGQWERNINGNLPIINFLRTNNLDNKVISNSLSNNASIKTEQKKLNFYIWLILAIIIGIIAVVVIFFSIK